MNNDVIFEYSEPTYFSQGLWVSIFLLALLVLLVLYLGIRSYQRRKNFDKVLFRRLRTLLAHHRH